MKTKTVFFLTLLVAIAMGTRAMAANEEAYAVFTSGNSTLTFYYDDQKNGREGDKYSLNTGENTPGWIDDGKQFEKVVFAKSFASYYPTTTSQWFSGQAGLKTITNIKYLKTDNVEDMFYMFRDCSILEEVDVSGFNTSRVRSMACMFVGCDSLKSLDVSGWNTSNVINMTSVFYGCSSLTRLDVSGWDTSKVSNMSFMFYMCASLSSLDVSGWDTSKVTNMQELFCSCYSLTNLDVSGWNTGNVTDMFWLFAGCINLANLDVSGWNTSKVTDMRGMFEGCTDLANLDVSGWNTGEVTDMRGMFYGCEKLESLDVSNWNTSKVTFTAQMFDYCTGLIYLDLSGWDTSNVLYMDNMFYNCSSLTTIYGGAGWNTENATNKANMFVDCNNLRGSSGTAYDPNHTDGTYAHIDGGPSNPGYFSVREYSLWVGGTRVTSENKDAISVASGTASYDPTTHTLTLNNATIDAGFYDDGISNGLPNLEGMSDFKIVCKGENNIVDAYNSDGAGLALYGNTTISGSRLGIRAYDKGIFADDDVSLTLQNADVYAEANRPIFSRYGVISVNHSRLEADPKLTNASAVSDAKEFNMTNCAFADLNNSYDPAHLYYETDEQILGMCLSGAPYYGPILIVPTQVSISTIINEAEAQSTTDRPMYNLSGQRVGKDYKGIVIHNGKKVLMK